MHLWLPLVVVLAAQAEAPAETPPPSAGLTYDQEAKAGPEALLTLAPPGKVTDSSTGKPLLWPAFYQRAQKNLHAAAYVVDLVAKVMVPVAAGVAAVVGLIILVDVAALVATVLAVSALGMAPESQTTIQAAASLGALGVLLVVLTPAVLLGGPVLFGLALAKAILPGEPSVEDIQAWVRDTNAREGNPGGAPAEAAPASPQPAPEPAKPEPAAPASR